MQRSLADRQFAATRAGHEVALRGARRYYAQLKLEHRNNAAIMAQIDRAYATERRRIMDGSAGAGDGASGGNRRARGLARKQFKYGLSMAAGEAGPEIGMLASALEIGGVAGVTMAGIATVAGVIKAAQRHTEDLVAVQRQYMESLRESARWWDEIVARQTTASGGHYTSRARDLRDAAAGVLDEAEAAKKNRGMFDHIWTGMQQAWRGGDVAATDYGQAQAERKVIALRKENEAPRLEAASKVEQRIAIERRAKDLAEQMEAATLPVRYSGDALTKARLDLAHTTALRKFNEKEMEDLRAEKLAGLGPDEAGQRAGERRNALAQMLSRLYSQRLDMEQQITRRKDAEMLADRVAAEQAQIAVRLDGAAKEIALLRHRHGQEIAEYDKASKDKLARLEVHKAEELAVQQRLARERYDIERGIRDRIYLAGAANPAELAARQAAIENRDLAEQVRPRAENNEQIKRMVDLLAHARQVEAARKVADDIAEMTMQIKAANGVMTQMEADIARYRQANPNATLAALDAWEKTKRQTEEAERAARQRQESAAFAKQQIETLKTPLQKFKEYRAQLERAREQGQLTPEQRDQLLGNRMKDLMGASRGNTGQIVDSSSRWSQIQSGILSRDDTQKLTLAEMKESRQILADLRDRGIPIKG